MGHSGIFRLNMLAGFQTVGKLLVEKINLTFGRLSGVNERDVVRIIIH